MVLRFFRIGLLCLIGGIILPSLEGKEERFEGYPLFSQIPYVPEQYSICESLPENWNFLFPHNPEFKYAFLFTGAFEKEMGFYLEGNELCWGRIVGIRSPHYVDSDPCFDVPKGFLSLRLIFPMSSFNPLWMVFSACQLAYPPSKTDVFGDSRSSLLNYMNLSEDDSCLYNTSLGMKGNYLSFQSFVISSLLMPARILLSRNCSMRDTISTMMYGYDESELELGFASQMLYKINKHFYAFFSTMRGRLTLQASTVDELRKTWDFAVTRRAFPMGYYYDLMGRLDGCSSVYRGRTGAIAEDYWLGVDASPLRAGMTELSFALMDMATAGHCGDESQEWIRTKCRVIRKYARELGDESPPFCSQKWSEDYLSAWMEHREQNAKSGYFGSSSEGDPFANLNAKKGDVSAEEEEKRIIEDGRKEKEAFREYLKCFKKPLEDNPDWKDIFPGDRGYCPAVLIMTRDPNYAFYVKDGILAYAENYISPSSLVMDSACSSGSKMELTPYQMFSGTGEANFRIKRDWIRLSLGEEQLLLAIQNKVMEKMALVEKRPDKEDSFYPILICRGRDGKSIFTVVDDEQRKGLMEVLQKAIRIYADHEGQNRRDIRKRLSVFLEELE